MSLSEAAPRSNALDVIARTKTGTLATVNRLRTSVRELFPSRPVAEPFDEQFAAVHTLAVPEQFPNPIRWVFVRPNEPTNKAAVALVCGFNEKPDNAKPFMRLLVENGWPVISAYNFKHVPGLMPSSTYPEIIMQKAYVNNLVIQKAAEEHDIDKVHLFGHSMGAAVGTLTAAMNPDTYLSLTTYAPSGFVQADSRRKLIKMASGRPLQESASSIGYSLRHPVNAWREGGGIAGMQIDTLLPIVRQMDINILGIFGNKDPMVPKEERQLFPDGFEPRQFDYVLEVPEGGHSDFIQRPDVYASEVEAFMQFLLQVEQSSYQQGGENAVFSAA